MDDETRRFVTGLMYGSIAGVVAWAFLLWMIVQIVDRVP